MTADLDDPLTRIAIWVRPGYDLDVTQIGKLGMRSEILLTTHCRYLAMYTHDKQIDISMDR